MLHVWTFFVLTLAVCDVSGYQKYQSDIPNGNRVNHPCKANFVWWGVGHNKAGGGGARNRFGQDFANNGRDWARVCRLDSDNDGLTNGQELGDPDCKWKKGDANPGTASSITHPGICEPRNEAKCKAVNPPLTEICKEVEYDCPPTKESHVKTHKINFTKTRLKAQETLYYCQTFDLPADQDYHVIGTKPDIVNKQVAHHMILYGCPDKPKANAVAEKFRQPRPCTMEVTTECSASMGGWSVGETGECLGKEYGFRFGKSSLKKAVLQIHWNNPEKSSTEDDSSGMSLYYTSQLRPNDGSVFTLGQLFLEIPPGKPQHIEKAYCPAYCTRNMPKPITLVGGSLHMHYLGRGGSLTIKKKGSTETTVLMNQTDYKYDSPKTFYYKNTAFAPGDELAMTCNFNSVGKTAVTEAGEGTQEEMCYVFITYFPVSTFDGCVQYKQFQTCEDAYSNCSATQFWTAPKTYEKMNDVLVACNTTNETKKCKDSCLKKIADMKREPCWQGEHGKLVIRELPSVAKEENFGQRLVKVLSDCSPKPKSTKKPETSVASVIPNAIYLVSTMLMLTVLKNVN